ncbi:YegJ family protein [Caulobacter mirabilis]|uniref:DUF2314 domain-containing protein n=1 Tax=Caulobacter mirabilis TaxID=69666 RepID=A0A2D2AZP2_9CAUL|nr:DUF2314 domain-containing protein [Caulobacter mirabilis]ATQ43476.1 hypothetical protein CSW64_14180 [Caulobacter mirabilis]
MRRLVVTLTLAAALFGGAPAFAQQDQPDRSGDPIIYYDDGHAEMNAAIEAAQKSAPVFLRLLAADRTVAQTGAVKIGFPHKDGEEYMWLVALKRDGDKLTGRLDNRPEHDVGYAEGDIVAFDADQIVDWYYNRDGRMYGSYTTRVMLPRLAPADADQLRALLSDKPLEDGRP